MPTSLPPVSLIPTLPSFLKLMNRGSGLEYNTVKLWAGVERGYLQVALVLSVETRFLPGLPGTQVVLSWKYNLVESSQSICCLIKNEQAKFKCKYKIGCIYTLDRKTTNITIARALPITNRSF